MQQAAYILWRHPRVRNLTHYQWEDERVRRDGPKSGLLRLAVGAALLRRARRSRSFGVFAAPLVYDRRRALLWGQVRPGGAHQLVPAGARPGRDHLAGRRADHDGRGTATGRPTIPVDERADYRVAWIDPPAPARREAAGHTSAVLNVESGAGRLRTSTGRGS